LSIAQNVIEELIRELKKKIGDNENSDITSAVSQVLLAYFFLAMYYMSASALVGPTSGHSWHIWPNPNFCHISDLTQVTDFSTAAFTLTVYS